LSALLVDERDDVVLHVIGDIDAAHPAE